MIIKIINRDQDIIIIMEDQEEIKDQITIKIIEEDTIKINKWEIIIIIIAAIDHHIEATETIEGDQAVGDQIDKI